MRVLVIGAGGHGQVVADILLRMADTGLDVTLAGFLDDNVALKGRSLIGAPVLGGVADLTAVPHDAVVVAVGDNRARQQLATILSDRGERFAVARHPRAVLAPDVTLGPGSMVCAGVVVNTGAVVGAHAILNTGCTVDHHNAIGDCVHIAPGAHLAGDVAVGDGTLVGIGASVMARLTIGAWAVVAAGAVVTRDVPAGATAVGVPARLRAGGRHTSG